MAEETQKKKRGRRAYLDDFQVTVSGEYIYVGDTYAFQGSKQAHRRLLFQLGGLSLAMVAATVTAGCIRAPGTLNCGYIVIPYVVSLVSAISLVWALIQLATAGTTLRSYVHHRTVEAFPTRSMLTVICSSISILGELLYVLLNGTEGMAGGMLLFLFCQAAVLTGALLWRRLTDRIVWVRSSGKK